MIEFFVGGLMVGFVIVAVYHLTVSIYERLRYARVCKRDWRYGMKLWLKFDTPLEPFLKDWKV